ncbi:DUF805 domain-containing protein [Rhodopseudomonas sp. P2A-2r]|uniref:DUF805 domain-containing protein n=1 Tax=unclassified Rhodopseudomonas TaxID=2638247 RepID=UPI002234AAED|nr:DUF805 domain-containing protein [Rhodopseudomonas sp. P2A-2r]UZE50904.1 DUF805 domain-containing protein [Rhodopseudomonas sp. P2A-2r]
MQNTSAIKGRMGRARYWIWSGLCALAAMVGLVLVVGTVNQTSQSPVNVPATIAAIAGAFMFVAACVALVVIGVWRLHDRGKSGFWIVLYYGAPSVLALMAVGPQTDGILQNGLALAILGWAMIDLGALEAAEPLAA